MTSTDPQRWARVRGDHRAGGLRRVFPDAHTRGGRKAAAHAVPGDRGHLELARRFATLGYGD
jgi:hypothetical protein